jgi:hypothetical protein
MYEIDLYYIRITMKQKYRNRATTCIVSSG